VRVEVGAPVHVDELLTAHLIAVDAVIGDVDLMGTEDIDSRDFDLELALPCTGGVEVSGCGLFETLSSSMSASFVDVGWHEWIAGWLGSIGCPIESRLECDVKQVEFGGKAFATFVGLGEDPSELYLFDLGGGPELGFDAVAVGSVPVFRVGDGPAPAVTSARLAGEVAFPVGRGDGVEGPLRTAASESTMGSFRCLGQPCFGGYFVAAT